MDYSDILKIVHEINLERINRYLATKRWRSYASPLAHPMMVLPILPIHSAGMGRLIRSSRS